MIVVQEIISAWTKQARAADAATARNAVPQQLDFPWLPEVDSASALVHHRIRFHERTNFGTPEHEIDVSEMMPFNRLRFGCVTITQREQLVQVTYAYNVSCGGAPKRATVPRQVFTLARGEWGRVVYNGRWGWGAWTYEQTTLNVLHAESLTQPIFAGEPKTIFRDLADLR
ncbi:MAG: hypothetical protein JOZ51_01105 [Chloroflexi bacterium]|nr:hypothetical protein [Chloroflexota bacterium]